MTVRSRDQDEGTKRDPLLSGINKQHSFTCGHVEPFIRIVCVAEPRFTQLMEHSRPARCANKRRILSRGATDEIALDKG
jgi:hypothetical protein